MDFIPFQKIPTDTSQYNLTKKEENTIFKESRWIALEKVNGSNFSVYCDGNITKFAKRTGFLKDNQWFYSYENIADELETKIKLLYYNLLNKNNNDNYIILYGELFGGFYPQNPENWK